MYNICRPIMLYNDFLPPERKPHDNWQYMAFGYFDGITIGDNLYRKEMRSFEQLWEWEIQQTKKLKEKQSVQIIYGFRNEKDNDLYEESFWQEANKEDTSYPFIFVALLQGDIIKNEEIAGYKTALEKELTEEGKRKALTYVTFDNCNIVVVLLCKDYEDGAEVIDEFHRFEEISPLKKTGINLRYSFSIGAIQRTYLNSSKTEEKKDKKIEQVYIYAIEKYPGSIKNVYYQLSVQLQGEIKYSKKSVLGCNDEMIILNDIPWSEFLKLFKDVTGLFNHSCYYYEKYLTGITTIITKEQKDLEDIETGVMAKEQEGLENKDDESKNMEQMLSAKLRGLITKIIEHKTESGNLYNNLEHYLYRVINALQKFEKTPLEDYVFCSMFLPIHMVLKISDENDILQRDFTEYFYQFVKGLNLCVQNSVHSDRQFTQSLDFDIRIYNTPVRLNAFYNAFIYFIKNFLNTTGDFSETKNNYEFLSYLGVTDNVQVYELFKNMSDRNRLFLVNIPENQAYDMKLMMIMLGHEVGHFVGQTIRCREERYDYSRKIAARIVTVYFKCNLNGEKNFWELFETKWKRKIRENMMYFENIKDLEENTSRAFDSDDLKNVLELSRKYKYYTHILRYTLEESVIKCLSENREELFGYLLGKEYLDGLEKDRENAEDRRKKLDMNINNLSLFLTGHSVWTGKSFSMAGALELLMTFFKECEADLVAILTLRLSLEDYLYAIWKSLPDKMSEEEPIPDEIIMRSAFVTYCMIYQESNEYYWDESELVVINNSKNALIKELMRGIINYGTDHHLNKNRANEDSEVLEPVEVIQCIDVFNDEKVANLVLSYLKECKKAFFETFKNKPFDEQNSLVDIYKLCQEKDAEKLVWRMQEYIERYKMILQKEIENTI